MKELVDGFDNEELAQKIEWEGLEYFFTDYISIMDIADLELREAVQTFKDALQDIESILRENEVLL